ncbi:uncharacterized protein LOC136067675 [Quercus suber]|uniref:uncharacterized protein LOC136067675 n=1 Tax=Quercus suber TaxID=58331 RepID=UPI0032DED3DB
MDAVVRDTEQTRKTKQQQALNSGLSKEDEVLPERQRQPTRTKDQQVRWQPPSTMKFKITFDGVVFKEEKRAGLGVVIRNHQGQVHASLTENVALPPSIMEVEALAAIRVVSFEVELGVSSIIIEGEFEVVIKAMRSEEESLSTYGHLIAAARQIMDSFSSLSFTHTHRQGNNLAHNLARHARHVSSYLVWREDVPPQLQSVLQADFG